MQIDYILAHLSSLSLLFSPLLCSNVLYSSLYLSPNTAMANELCMTKDALPTDFKFFQWATVSLSVCLSMCLSVYLSVCLSICLSIFLCICLSSCFDVCLSFLMSVCLSVSVFVSHSIIPLYLQPNLFHYELSMYVRTLSMSVTGCKIYTIEVK